MFKFIYLVFIYNIALAHAEIVDLSHTFDKDTIYWPTEKGFKLTVLAYGETSKHYFYSANKFCAPEHGGTHIDAPIHFAKHGITVDKIAPQQLIGDLLVIDVHAQIKHADYQITLEDIKKFEKKVKKIQAGDIVFFRTDWSKYWPNKRQYMGTDKLGDLKNLHFPGISIEAATYLVDKNIKGVGIDSPSMDPGQSNNFPVHRIILGAGKYGLENLTKLNKLPAVGATVYIAPMKIGGGSGAPTRIFAIINPGQVPLS